MCNHYLYYYGMRLFLAFPSDNAAGNMPEGQYYWYSISTNDQDL